MSTIRRNSKRAAEVLEKAKGVKVHTLRNGFSGEPLPADPVDPAALESGTRTTPSGYLRGLLSIYDFAKLRDNGDGTYSLTVYSNEWFTFTN